MKSKFPSNSNMNGCELKPQGILLDSFFSVHIINGWISLLKTSYILLKINVSCITKSLKSVLLNQINGLSLMDMTELLWFHHSVLAPNKSQQMYVYFLNVALMLQRVL